jgi:formylglycine-generating enzyme required for sulfatase activity
MDDIQRYRNKLKRAKRRLVYWSGNPSFNNFGFVPGRRSRKDNTLEYEIAWNDVNSLADRLEQLTGKRPKVVDVRAEWRRAASILLTIRH